MWHVYIVWSKSHTRIAHLEDGDADGRRILKLTLK
jgi:hypothetical protein